ncbi:hypothetical protein BCT49_01690 [Vibrio lentus]|uniref:Uncharacterized protein n=1 Tax=Vibrio lentus TaxID=136468 RepID=A0A2N7KC68_9VIBR|nr:hypothetical protein BCT49_01690 [Vibrio lentus]
MAKPTKHPDAMTSVQINKGFQLYHLNVLKRWYEDDREGLVLELVQFSLDILVSSEGFTVAQIAKHCNCTL